MHPLLEDLALLKDAELENKIQALNKKYFQASNPTVRHQILLLLDGYKEELRKRRDRQWQDQYQKRDTDLDNLINVN